MHNYKPKYSSGVGGHEPKPTKKYLIRCAKLTVLWYLCSSVVVLCENIVTDYDTKEPIFETIYYRITVNTTWFSLSQLLVFIAMNAIGFMFVNRVNMERHDPFASGNRRNHHHAFKLACTLFAPILFIMSGIVTKRQAHDLSGYCASEQINENIAVSTTLSMLQTTKMMAPHQLDDSISDSTLRLFHSIGELNLVGENSVPSCKVYTNMEIFKFNYFVWTLGLFAGLQWTHIDVGPMKNLTLEWDIMKTWGKGMWILFLSILLFILGVVYVTFHVYYVIGYLKWYILYLIWGIGFIALKTYLVRDTKKLHIHHYFWSSVIVTFLCY